MTSNLPLEQLTRLFREFLESEKSSGTILLICTIVSVILANSFLGREYADFWNTGIGFDAAGIHLRHSLKYWINDGLMAIFFLMIGLEIERELYVGELSNPRNTTLPIVAAIGGMLVPALFHFMLNHGSGTQGGAGIPMATDIAFAVGVLALLGKKIPVPLKVFLTALAIIDDLGAIIVISLFYVADFSPVHFFAALGIFAGLLVLNCARVYWLPVYLVSGCAMWYFMLQSGVHATITGVLLAFAVPFGRGDSRSPSYRLQHRLHKPVALVILPLFALANTGIPLTGGWIEGLTARNSLGILAGLAAGKPLGIALFSYVSVKLGFSRLPESLTWKDIVGAGFLGGIGFTMSIFITLLAFEDADLIQASKLSVLVGSAVSGLLGFLILHGRQAPGQRGTRGG